MSVESNITKSDQWFQGEDKVLEFTIFQSDGTTPQNITGWTLEYELCDLDGITIFTKVTGGGILITDGLNGVLQVNIDTADTLATSVTTESKFKHELRRTDVGNVSTLVSGTVQIQEGC